MNVPDTPSAPLHQSAPTSLPKTSTEATFDLRHFFLVLQERWLGATGLALLVCGLLGYYLLSRPPVYTAIAALQVDKPERVVDMKPVENNDTDSAQNETILLTHIEKLQSHRFYQQLFASLTPTEREQVLAPYRETVRAASTPSASVDSPKSIPSSASSATATTSKIGPAPVSTTTSAVVTDTSADTLPPVLSPEDAERELEKFFKNHLVVGRNKRTLIIDITASHRDPIMAQLLANRAAEQYVLFLAKLSHDLSANAGDFLGGEVKKFKDKVDTAEQNLQAYQKKYSQISFQDDQSVVSQRVLKLSASVTDARLARQTLDDKVQQMRQVMNDGSEQLQLATLTQLNGAASTSKLDNLSEVQNALDKLRSDRVVLSQRYGKNYTEMLSNQKSIDALQKVRKEYLDAAVTDLVNQRDNAILEQTQVEHAYAEAEADSLKLSELTVGYNNLLREADSARTNYAEMVKQQTQTAITTQLQNTNIKIVDQADKPVAQTSPDPVKISLILAVLGGLIICGYPILTDSLDDRIKSWHDVESYLNTTLLGEISQAINVPEEERGVIVAENTDEGVVEAFRGLHSQFLITTKLEPPRTILITSTVPGEGKSFVSANLAAAFASHGNRTILIDCDFRRPSQHRLANLDNKLGSLKWLELNIKPDSNLLANPALGITELGPRNFLLRTGGSSRKITELLSSGNLTSLFTALQQQFDIVIFDTPPSGVFPDSEIFARLADDLIYVCRFKGARRVYCRQVLTRLLKAGVNFTGVVLNSMPTSRSQAYYYSGYGYYYAKEYKKYYKSHDADEEKREKKAKKAQPAP